MLRRVRKGQLATGFAGTQVCDPEEGPGWEPWRAERGYIRWGGGQVGGPSSLARPWARELTGCLLMFAAIILVQLAPALQQKRKSGTV